MIIVLIRPDNSCAMFTHTVTHLTRINVSLF